MDEVAEVDTNNAAGGEAAEGVRLTHAVTYCCHRPQVCTHTHRTVEVRNHPIVNTASIFEGGASHSKRPQDTHTHPNTHKASRTFREGNVSVSGSGGTGGPGEDSVMEPASESKVTPNSDS